MTCNNCPDQTAGTCGHQLIRPSALIKDIKNDINQNAEKRKNEWYKEYGGGLFDEIDRLQK